MEQMGIGRDDREEKKKEFEGRTEAMGMCF